MVRSRIMTKVFRSLKCLPQVPPGTVVQSRPDISESLSKEIESSYRPHVSSSIRSVSRSMKMAHTTSHVHVHVHVVHVG